LNNGCGKELTTVQNIFEFIVKIIAYAGSAAAAAYAIFLFLGKKWIENLFDERIKRYVHKLDRELEEFKYELNSRFNGVTRRREREFEILPEAFHKLQNTLVLVCNFMSEPKEVPNLDDMEESQLKEFLSNSILTELEEKELIKKPHKVEYYKWKRLRYALKDAQEEFSEFRNYIVKNKIFINPQLLLNKFEHIGDFMQKILLERKMSKPSECSNLGRVEHQEIEDRLNHIRDEIEQLIKERLRCQDE